MKFSPEQNKAILLRGDSLTVSAAAGAGKTAVLTERVVQRLCDTEHGCDADRLLILTFTNAAAAEMRRRISDKLKDRLKNDPGNAHLKRQLALLPAAGICTIHSACFDLIRKNFEKLDIDPQFSVAEEAQLQLMRSEFTDDFAEKLYQRAESDSDIMSLISYFVKGKDDAGLLTALEYGCDFLEKEPYPQDFIERCCTDDASSVFDMLPRGHIYTYCCFEVNDILEKYEKLSVQAGNAGYEKLESFYLDEKESMQAFAGRITARDYDGAANYAAQLKFKNHPSCPKDADDVHWNIFKSYREELKSRLRNLADGVFYDNTAAVLSDRKKELNIINTYLTLCLELNTKLEKERRRLNIISFNDAEKYTLSLLIQSHDGDNIIKTELARQLSEFYDEIIVDEFQDCSKIQDYIFRALSKDEKNIFTVGDVKQSIYRFRNAYPEIFIQRQQNAQDPMSDMLTCPSRLSLNQNFRSHPKILDFVNRVFDTLMTKQRGDIDYMSSHRLYNGGLYEGFDGASVNLCLIADSDSKNSSALSRLESEAAYVTQKIKSIVGKLKIYDTETKTERTVCYGDIAILMRAPKTTGAVFENTLRHAGIECVNNNPSEKYLDTLPVRDMIAYLQAIDNPYNDIALITLMYSDYFGFTVNELGAIRAQCKGMLFYDAVKKYARTDKKAEAFVKTLENYREKSSVTDVYGLISMIYEQSGVLLRVLGEPGGEEIRANLLMLSDIAAKFENIRYRGLFAFINYLLGLIKKDQNLPAAKLRKSDSCVNILSVHHSKGLEYPVVFLVCTGNDITIKISGDILLDSRLGAGAFVRDDKTHRDFSSICRNAVKEKMKTDELNEYIRLLYVALTRAKQHLFITGAMTADNAEKAIISADRANARPSNYDIYSSPSFLKWILYAVTNTAAANPFRAFAGIDTINNDTGLFDVEIVPAQAQDQDDDIIQTDRQDIKEFSQQYIKQMTSRQYPYLQSTLIPSKLSVSEIKSIKSESGSDAKSKIRPAFMQNGATGAERGNATHKFLQFCNFSAVHDMQSLDNEADRLTKLQFISKRDAALIEKEKILTFLTSDKMRRLNALGTCSKEQRFLFSVSADEILDTDSTENVIVQGVIDCWYTDTDGHAVIVDYKTDSVTDPNVLIERYSVQLDMYAKAIYRLKGIQTSHKYIYSFSLSEFIEV